jgi:hypothetical protein
VPWRAPPPPADVPGLPGFAPFPAAAIGPEPNDSGYLDAVAVRAAAPVAAKHTGVLAAADVFTLDNAATLAESFRVDAGLPGPFGTRP